MSTDAHPSRTRPCLHCHQPYTPSWRGYKRKFCCDTCRRGYAYQAAAPKDCASCGQSLAGCHPRAIRHPSCALAFAVQSRREYRAESRTSPASKYLDDAPDVIEAKFAAALADIKGRKVFQLGEHVTLLGSSLIGCD